LTVSKYFHKKMLTYVDICWYMLILGGYG
jgi:hypothetical protein